MDADPLVNLACTFVVERFPHAAFAFLEGSVAEGRVAPTSDLDVLVVLDGSRGDAAASYVETLMYGGRLVEAFVHSRDGLRPWLERGRRERRPVLDRLIAEGVPLLGGAEAQSWSRRSAEVLAAGPAPLDAQESASRRYQLSALVDDLEDVGGGADEPWMIGAHAWRAAAELRLLTERRWLGSGRWLLRELRSAAEEGIDDLGLIGWAEGTADICAQARIARAVLAAAGGYLHAGHLRDEKPRRR